MNPAAPPSIDPMTATDLPRCDPESQGLPSTAILAFVDRLEREGLEPHSLMVLRHGHVVAEGWWVPYHRDGVQLVYSLSKSFASCAVGLAVAEGRLGLADRLADHFPQAASGVGPRARALTVHNVLSMATGHRLDTLEPMLDPAHTPESAFFGYEPEEEPGTWFVYNNGATFMAGALVQKVTGQRLLDYLQPRLFEPVGMGAASWIALPDGRDAAFSGLHVRTEAVARLGQLLLSDGIWRGRRVLPEGWVEQATSRHTDNAMNEAGIDWQVGYGYQFWHCRHGAYRGDGAYGQFCLVLPQSRAVVAMTSCTEDLQAVLDAVWDELLPAFAHAPLPDDPAGRARLAERLARARLPVLASASGAVPDESGSGSPGPWLFRHEPGGDHPLLRSVEVHASGTGWEFVVDDGGTVVVPCADGGWPEPTQDGTTAPFVASGGWTAPGVFEARIVAVQTPHALLLRCADAMVTARWNGVPLHTPWLAGLVAPTSVEVASG